MNQPSALPTNLDLYFRDVHHYKPLSREQEQSIGPAIRAHDAEAVDALVRANLRFVVTIAKKFAGYGVPLEDLISEGNLGLIEAAKRFDERRGFKFISYAVWWIRQSIMLALARQSKSVRMPLNRARALQRLRRVIHRAEQSLGHPPTVEDLAGSMETSREEVELTLPLLNDSVSLEGQIGDETSTSYIDMLEDEQGMSPELPVLENELQNGVSLVLTKLRPREAEVLRLYFGLEGCEPVTLQEIGDRMHLTRERIRQIKEEALHKMRAGSRFKFLKDYREMTTLH